MLLVGDIGGTHTRLALFAAEKKLKCIREKKFSSQSYPSLQEIISLFLKEEKEEIKGAAFGIAGPIKDGVCTATNLPWVIDQKELIELLQIENVYLLNDLEAKAYGVSELEEKDLLLINKGKHHPGNAAIVAPGTGLGEAGLFFDEKEYHPFACEGGHTDFAPQNELEIELFSYLQKIFGHVSYERVVSGPGLLNIYQFLLESKRVTKFAEYDQTSQSLLPDSITQLGLAKKDEGARFALEIFLSIFGAEVGNVALKFFALSGIYLGGGISMVIREDLKKKTFLDSYYNKGRFSKFVKEIPLYVILNEKCSLMGAASFVRKALKG